MQVVSFPARQARAHYRHELRTLTYVTLDQANGGIIRNLNHEGVAVQAVAPLRQQQRVRLRFELRFPRLRVEAYGQVSWASSSGQCGIRFVDLPENTSHQINQWIFSNLLDALARDAGRPRSIFGISFAAREENVDGEQENDGLTVSAAPRPAIRLEPAAPDPFPLIPQPILLQHGEEDVGDADADPQLSWLSRPLSGRSVAWLVDSLVVVAALLLFAFIFLAIAHELPPWRLALATGLGAAVFVAATYRAVFGLFGGPSLGTRLAQAAAGLDDGEEEAGVRIR
jgi:hypothetical protein